MNNRLYFTTLCCSTYHYLVLHILLSRIIYKHDLDEGSGYISFYIECINVMSVLKVATSLPIIWVVAVKAVEKLFSPYKNVYPPKTLLLMEISKFLCMISISVLKRDVNSKLFCDENIQINHILHEYNIY